MSVTLADIAAPLGISPATVSRALNGRPGVSAQVRDLVLKASAAAGYVGPATRSPDASTQKVRLSPLVGVIVPELDNPVFPAFASVMTTMLAEQGYLPMLCSQSEPGISEDTWISLLTANHVQGIIVVSGMHADTLASVERYRKLREAGTALVLVNGYVPGLDASFVSVDDAAAADFAYNYLVGLGHQRIGLALGPERYVPVIRKTHGYTRAINQHAGVVDPIPLVAHSTFSQEGGFSAANHLLDDEVTAIICASDVMAIGAIRAVRARNLRVPQDVSIIGFDDSPSSAYIDPPLTSLQQPIRAMATAAVSALLEEMRNGILSTREFLFTADLIARSSTAPPHHNNRDGGTGKPSSK